MPVPNLFEFSAGVPLTEDVWLGMQLRNVLLVDEAILRPIESDALQEYVERDRTPLQTLMILNAASQMWLFSLYEFLRTWRQRAKELIRFHDEVGQLTADEKATFFRERTEEVQARERMIRIGSGWYSEQVEKLDDVEHSTRIRTYLERTEEMFREIEALRVTLAKHEVPRTQLVAEAPGYARMNYQDGALYWFYTLRDGTQGRLDRREFADDFYSVVV